MLAGERHDVRFTKPHIFFGPGGSLSAALREKKAA